MSESIPAHARCAARTRRSVCTPAPGGAAWLRASLWLLSAMLLNACGGGSGDADIGASLASQNTSEDTGTAYITLTDAEGAFVTYSVDVMSIALERADGTLVETLPIAARIDFARYVDLTEMFSSAQIPTGAYVGGAITLDYTTADIQVEVAGVAVPAIVVDEDGAALGQYTLTVRLEEQDRLIVAPGRPALFEIDFDLDASHEVDTLQSPPLVTAAPFLVADVEPVDEKELRIRGPLVAVDIDASSYDLRLRPWHLRDGDFGPVTVNVTDATEYEIDGVAYTGGDGLTALAGLDAGTPTVAGGVLDIDDREFTAVTVLAGDSVPGHGFDAVLGNVVGRNGNVLTVSGATIVPDNVDSNEHSAVFNDTVEILVGDDTIVTQPGMPGVDFGIAAISVGQRVNVLGTITSDPAAPELTMDATAGRVRLKITRLTGMVNTVMPGLLTMNLRGIHRRDIGRFDLSGTGITAELDADPADYEVDTSTLGLEFIDPDTPVQVFGYVNEFGAAPPDFSGRTIVDVADVRAKLAIGWLPDGTTAPFLSMGPDGLVPDLENPDLGDRHHLNIGGDVVDLLDLPAAPQIASAQDRRTRFAIMQGRRVQVFRDFDRFVEALGELLDGATVARGLHAVGAYDRDSNTLAAHTIGVRLEVPSTN